MTHKSKLDRFCWHCGARMKLRVVPSGFDEESGDDLFFAFFTCPKATPPIGFWKSFFVSREPHVYEKFDNLNDGDCYGHSTPTHWTAKETETYMARGVQMRKTGGQNATSLQ